VPDVLDSQLADIARFVAEQKDLLERWVRQRKSEEPDLDPAKLRHALGGYIEWSAHVVQAVAVGLKARRTRPSTSTVTRSRARSS
jgi:hypothetical protein